MQVRTIFSKTSAMRFTGHLDVQRAIERIFRRARLPLAYTQGFSQHARITLASPPALGFTSSAEIADFWLDEDLPLDTVRTALEQASPPGIIFNTFSLISAKEASIASRLIEAEYYACIPAAPGEVEAAVAALLAAESLLRQRRERTYDLRALILALALPDPAACRRVFSAPPYIGVLDPAFLSSGTVLWMRLCAEGGKTGRPDEVIDALGFSALESHVHRDRLILQP